MKVTKDEALKKILQRSFALLKTKEVVLEEAFENILAQKIEAKFNLPAFNTSAVDGFAFDIDKISSFPAKLKIARVIKAGEKEDVRLGENQAAFIMTGAKIPLNANCVVRVEDAEYDEDEVVILKEPKKWDLINLKASEVAKGEIVLQEGEFLDYKKVALLANIGHYKIKVYQKPSIGIIITGDEIKEPWQECKNECIKNVNYYILKGAMEKYANINYYGIIKDDVDKMQEVFEKAMEENDILVSSGGASKGKFDFTKTITKRLNLKVEFTTTNIKPGRPLVFATKGKKLFFGLPGYPAALLVNMHQFLLPCVKKTAGLKNYLLQEFEAVAKEEFRSKKNRVDYIRSSLFFENGELKIKPNKPDLTSNYLTIAFAEALAIFEEESEGAKTNEKVKFILI